MNNLSIVILNWNGLEFLKKCVPSVIKAVNIYGNYCEIIVVDNSSTEESIDYLKSNFPKVRIISLKENLGFAKAMNIGIREAKYLVVIGLNNDVIVEEDFINPLVRHFAQQDTFAVGSKMLLWDRKTLNFGRAKPNFLLGLLRIKFEDACEAVSSLYACGGAFAVDKNKFLALSGFDEDLHYYEDVDLCFRAWKNGWRTVFEPNSIVYHKYQGTAAKIYGKYGLAILSKKNYFLFVWKNIHDRRLISQHIIFIPFWCIVALLLGRFYFAQGLFRALKSCSLFLEKRKKEKQKEIILSEREILTTSLKQDVKFAGRTKILQIGKFYYPYIGGTEMHLFNLVNELRKKGNFEIDILVSNIKFKTELEGNNGFKIIRLANLGNFISLPLCLSYPFWFKKLKADILHFHLPNPLAVIAYLLARPKGRVVVSYHSDIIRQRIFMPFFKPWLLKFLKNSEAIIVTSPNIIDNSPILKRFRNKCKIIPHGIDTEQFKPTDEILGKAQCIRKEYGAALILFVGRLVYYKSLEFLIKAMENIDAKLLIVGEGPLKRRLIRLSQQFNVSDKVIWVGAVENVAPFYYACDVFVLPSSIKAESFGIVQLEAFTCGKPVVSTNLPTGVPFVNQDKKTGLIVPPKDSEALSRAINRLLASQELRKRYGDMAKERVEKEFTKGRMAEEIIKVYFG